MIRLGTNHVLINNRHDFEDIFWEEKDTLRTKEGVFHNLNKIKYPHCFKYHESWDAHFCGDWYPCNKESAIEDLKENTDFLTKKLKESKKTLNKIENMEEFENENLF